MEQFAPETIKLIERIYDAISVDGTSQVKAADYLEQFNHPVPMQAFRSLEKEELLQLINQALEQNQPVKEWQERECLQTGSVMDYQYKDLTI